VVTSTRPAFRLSLDLRHEVRETSSSVGPSKAEVRCRKAARQHWDALEAAPPGPPLVPRYPSSVRVPRDWDRVGRETDEPQGDAALEDLFRRIYANASDDTRRAMIKSYTESGGTVLSTNWDEVKEGRVRPEPPPGLEPKRL
jgi:suppressor of G2 allele of SKP1